MEVIKNTNKKIYKKEHLFKDSLKKSEKCSKEEMFPNLEKSTGKFFASWLAKMNSNNFSKWSSQENLTGNAKIYEPKCKSKSQN